MVLASPVSCMGEELAVRLSNAVRLNYASSDRWLSDERHYYLATFESKALVDFSPSLRGAVQLRATRTLGPVERSTVHIPFAYLDVKTPSVDFRIGKQILAWGRTDALNPTDVVTPRDYTTMLPFDEDERRGVWGVRSNVYAGETIVASLFYGWRFKPSTLPFVSDRFAFGLDEARRRQLGMRISTSNPDFDFSVSAYRGAGLLAEAQRVAGGVTRFGYPEIDMLGADFARNFGKYGVRIEGAGVRPRGPDPSGGAGMRPYRYLVAGADRTFFSDLNVNLQLFGRWTSAGPGPDGAIEAINNLIYVQTRKHTYGMTLRVANQWMNQTLGAELFVQRYFGDGSTYVHPQVSYAISDHWKATAGAAWFAGREGSLFGVMKKNNGVFAELRYSF